MIRYIHKFCCPYCGKRVVRTHLRAEDFIGDPLRTCTRCRQSFYDFSYTENAIFYYNHHTESHLLSAILHIVLEIGLVFVFIRNIIPLVIIAILSFFSMRRMIIEIKFIGRKEQRIIQVEDYLDSSELKDGELRSSIVRLSNPRYLDFLTDNDVAVPDFFYNRIGYNPPEKYKEKHGKKEKKEADELKQLLERQKIYNNAKVLLAKGAHSREFREVASQCSMTEDQFKLYCKKTIEEYERLHKEYNLTHKTPAPFLRDMDME